MFSLATNVVFRLSIFLSAFSWNTSSFFSSAVLICAGSIPYSTLLLKTESITSILNLAGQPLCNQNRSSFFHCDCCIANYFVLLCLDVAFLV